jgi:hypothetical protein
MTLLITQSNPDVKRAAAKPPVVSRKVVNIRLKGPYYPDVSLGTPFNVQTKALGGFPINSGSAGQYPVRTKIVKVTLNPGDLLNSVSNVHVYSGDNTLVSVTGYPGVKPTKTYIKLISDIYSRDTYLYSAFPFGSGSKKITKKTTLTFTFKKANNFGVVLAGPKPTNSGGFFWYGRDKTVMIGPTNRNLTSLTIPKNTKLIPANAFNACTKLTGNLVIPNSVTYIGSYAFRDCTKLAGSLTIQNTNIKLGDEVFSGNGGLTGSISLYRSNITETSLNGLDSVTKNYLGEN